MFGWLMSLVKLPIEVVRRVFGGDEGARAEREDEEQNPWIQASGGNDPERSEADAGSSAEQWKVPDEAPAEEAEEPESEPEAAADQPPDEDAPEDEGDEAAPEDGAAAEDAPEDVRDEAAPEDGAAQEEPKAETAAGPSLGPNTDLSTFQEGRERSLERAEQASDTDAMGLDKRRQIVGGTYGMPRGKLVALYATTVAVIAGGALGLYLLAKDLDQPPEKVSAEAPWAESDAPTRPSKAIQ